MDVEIRLATQSDAATLARLRYELRSAAKSVIENEVEFRTRCESWMRERLREGSQWQCWVAEIDGDAVGAVWAQVVEKIPNPSSEGECFVYLTNFYVRDEYRSVGIGARLLAAVLDWSASKGGETVILWPTDRSVPFYQRHGFTFADDLMLKNEL